MNKKNMNRTVPKQYYQNNENYIVPYCTVPLPDHYHDQL